jgi:hypothetical protein
MDYFSRNKPTPYGTEDEGYIVIKLKGAHFAVRPLLE